MMAQKSNSDESRYTAGSTERIAADQNKVFVTGLRNVLWIEKALLHFIPKMMDFASSAEFKDALHAHHRHIKGHLISLESVFKTLRIHPESLKDTGIETVLTESEQSMKNNRNTAQDAQLAETLLQITKHKQDAYMALSEQAEALQMNDSARLLLELNAYEKTYADRVNQMHLKTV